MAKTRHIQQRMNQRGIKSEMLDIVQQFGMWQGDKCILNRKACNDVLSELDKIRRDVIKMKEKGGLVLVHDDGADITTYALESYKRSGK